MCKIIIKLYINVVLSPSIYVSLHLTVLKHELDRFEYAYLFLNSIRLVSDYKNNEYE